MSRSRQPSPGVEPSLAGVGRNARLYQRWAWGAAIWSVAYGCLGVFWAVRGAGFPFGVAQDPGARLTSVLEAATPGPVGTALAIIGVSGGLAALALAQDRGTPAVRRLLVGYGWVLAATFAVVLPDYRPLLAVVRAPVLLVGAPFGWPRQVSVTDFFALYLPWPVVNQWVLILGGVLWAGTAWTAQRRLRGACERCGRRPEVPRWSEPDALARWGGYAVGVAVAIPLFYAATRWCWALGIPLGISADELQTEAEDSPGIWLAGAALATMGAAGGFLTLGLVRPWGEVYPRWIPGLGGRSVRPRTAIVPAVLVCVLVTSAGLMYLRWVVVGRVQLTGDNWGLFVPELLWPLWGLALGAATFAYYLRRRGPCVECGRG